MLYECGDSCCPKEMSVAARFTRVNGGPPEYTSEWSNARAARQFCAPIKVTFLVMVPLEDKVT